MRCLWGMRFGCDVEEQLWGCRTMRPQVLDLICDISSKVSGIRDNADVVMGSHSTHTHPFLFSPPSLPPSLQSSVPPSNPPYLPPILPPSLQFCLPKIRCPDHLKPVPCREIAPHKHDVVCGDGHCFGLCPKSWYAQRITSRKKISWLSVGLLLLLKQWYGVSCS